MENPNTASTMTMVDFFIQVMETHGESIDEMQRTISVLNDALQQNLDCQTYTNISAVHLNKRLQKEILDFGDYLLGKYWSRQTDEDFLQEWADRAPLLLKLYSELDNARFISQMDGQLDQLSPNLLHEAELLCDMLCRFRESKRLLFTSDTESGEIAVPGFEADSTGIWTEAGRKKLLLSIALALQGKDKLIIMVCRHIGTKSHIFGYQMNNGSLEIFSKEALKESYSVDLNGNTQDLSSFVFEEWDLHDGLDSLLLQ